MRGSLRSSFAATGIFAAVFCGATLPVQSADRALLIGIGKYQNLAESQHLNGPKNDLLSMNELLTATLGFPAADVRILADEAATRDAILSSIDEWLVQGTAPGERAYLYFSGHGLQLADDNGDEQDGLDEALAPYDIVAAEKDWDRVIRDDEIEALTAKLKDRVVTLVFDASYSGTVENALKGAVAVASGQRYLPRIGAEPVAKSKTRGIRIDLAVVDKPEKAAENGVTSWNAASSYQVAADDTSKPAGEQQGVFTAAYVAGHKAQASDANKNGLVSNSELLAYVKTESAAYCAGQKGCTTLDPKLDLPAAALGASVTGAYQGNTGATKTEAIAIAASQTAAYVDADPVAAVADITGKAENGDVAVSLDKGTRLHNGDVFKISVTSKQDGHLILLDVNKDGKATQIFPNEFAEKITPLSAHSTLTIPDEYYGFDFEADGAGESVLVAIVVSDPVDIEAMAPKTRGLKIELNARESLSDIVQRLQATWTGDLENRGIHWSIGSLKYTIE